MTLTRLAFFDLIRQFLRGVRWIARHVLPWVAFIIMMAVWPLYGLERGWSVYVAMGPLAIMTGAYVLFCIWILGDN